MQRKTFARERPEDGALEFVDAETGEVVGVQKQSKANIRRAKEGKPLVPRSRKPYYMWKVNKNGTPLLVLNTQEATDLPDNFNLFENRVELCMNIAMLVAEGHSLQEITKMEGMPPASVIYNWIARNKEFASLVDESRRMRAEFYHDKIHAVAESVDEDNAKSAKVKLDAYKHLASVGDRDRFGQQTKVVGDPNKPISFVIDTGIKDYPIPVEGKVVDAITVEPGSNLDGVHAETITVRDPSEPEAV